MAAPPAAGFPPRGRVSGVPVVEDSPGGYAGVLRVLGREAGKGAATKNFSKPGQPSGAGKVEGLCERGGSREED